MPSSVSLTDRVVGELNDRRQALPRLLRLPPRRNVAADTGEPQQLPIQAEDAESAHVDRDHVARARMPETKSPIPRLAAEKDRKNLRIENLSLTFEFRVEHGIAPQRRRHPPGPRAARPA